MLFSKEISFFNCRSFSIQSNCLFDKPFPLEIGGRTKSYLFWTGHAKAQNLSIELIGYGYLHCLRIILCLCVEVNCFTEHI